MHGLVRDGQGKKMSKTTGNVIDPLTVIAEYGTDALRYTLVTGVTPGLGVYTLTKPLRCCIHSLNLYAANETSMLLFNPLCC